MRTSTIERNTLETQITLTLNLDGTGIADVKTGCGFLDHMLYHHTVEDIGIALGQAFEECLGDKRGITRYGQFLLPMDEALVLCAVDLSGRAYLGWAVDLPAQKVGDFDTELGKEFWLGFLRHCAASLHFRELSGENTHHILEAVFKGAGRALKQAVALDEKHRDEIPSTKGLL